MANNPQMKTKTNYNIIEQNGKFVVTKNGEQIVSSSTGASFVTKFDTKSDAEKYMTILKTLSGR